MTVVIFTPLDYPAVYWQLARTFMFDSGSWHGHDAQATALKLKNDAVCHDVHGLLEQTIITSIPLYSRLLTVHGAKKTLPVQKH